MAEATTPDPSNAPAAGRSGQVTPPGYGTGTWILSPRRFGRILGLRILVASERDIRTNYPRRFQKDTRTLYAEPGVGQLPTVDNFWASDCRLVTAFCDKEPRRLTRTAPKPESGK
jgi:hypothetical protein